MNLSKSEWISHLGLRRHEAEGGYYAKRYISDLAAALSGRTTMDTIFYMLTDDSPIGYFHRNRSDIVHFFHAGSPLRYTLIDPDGGVETFLLGPDPSVGHNLQLVVRSGYWKATELCDGTFGLLSEAVTPAFDSADRTIATRSLLTHLFPQLDSRLLRLAYVTEPLPADNRD